MGIELKATTDLMIIAALLVAGYLTFKRVRSDYQIHGKLTRFVAFLQTAYFCVYALNSYVFLDSRLSQINTERFLSLLAIVFMVIGFIVVFLSMPSLGRRSFGHEIGKLQTSGLYRYSRNPQLVGGFLFIAGYALLWPSWEGVLWAGLWLVIAHWMVRGEEEHLENVFGAEYHTYCKKTPRYLGLPKK